MKNVKFWILAILTTALIFAVFYMMITQVDENLQARHVDTTTAETEIETEIAFESVEISTTQEETDERGIQTNRVRRVSVQ